MTMDWCAGFFDGEGTVGYWQCFHKQRNRKYGRLVASVSQKERKALDVFQQITGVGKVRGPYKTNKGFYHYKLDMAVKDALKLYDLFKGKLVVKQEQFDAAVLAYKASSAGSRPVCIPVGELSCPRL